MTFCRLISCLGLALWAFALLEEPVRAQAPQYMVTVLGPVGATSWTSAINASGEVAGFAGSASSYAPVLWNGTSPTVLGIAAGTTGFGYGINASGQVVGSIVIAGSGQAASWSGTTPVQLPDTLGGSESGAHGINTSGQIAGEAAIAGNQYYHAVVWSGSTLTDLGNAGGQTAMAFGINDFGVAVGDELDFSSNYHAVRWTGTTPVILGGPNSDAYNINAAGQVVGDYATTGGQTHAVVWTGTTPNDLGTLGGTYSAAYGINDAGEIVGSSLTGTGGTAAFLYTGGTMYDLSTLLVPDSGVTGLGIDQFGNGINDNGQIAAVGTVDGQQDALLLTPTPEPSTAVTLFCGAALLALRRRR